MRSTAGEVIAESDVVVVGNQAAEFRDALQHTRPDQVVIDLVRLLATPNGLPARYEGLGW
jgi:hypothetical protein